MLEWIKALKEEMKPMLGDASRDSLPNGRGQPVGMKNKGKLKSEADVKVDPKAFNEVSLPGLLIIFFNLCWYMAHIHKYTRTCTGVYQ